MMEMEWVLIRAMKERPLHSRDITVNVSPYPCCIAGEPCWRGIEACREARC